MTRERKPAAWNRRKARRPAAPQGPHPRLRPDRDRAGRGVDYAGTQACKALREEGIETVLVNSNPATIMTDEGVADRVYLEPLTVDAIDASSRGSG